MKEFLEKFKEIKNIIEKKSKYYIDSSCKS